MAHSRKRMRLWATETETEMPEALQRREHNGDEEESGESSGNASGIEGKDNYRGEEKYAGVARVLLSAGLEDLGDEAEGMSEDGEDSNEPSSSASRKGKRTKQGGLDEEEVLSDNGSYLASFPPDDLWNGEQAEQSGSVSPAAERQSFGETNRL